MIHKYTDAKNAQILIALLKKHGIKKIVLNPGVCNIPFSGSIPHDPYFEVFSCVDERHAAYVACGLAAQSGEPVVISCTGATSSRNYLPALTEAFYRKLPVLAVTSTTFLSNQGHLSPQFMDRSVQLKDTVVLSVQCPTITTEQEQHSSEIKINNALLALTRHGGGPVHINLETSTHSFTTSCLPSVTAIHRYDESSRVWPEIGPDTKVAVWIGAHKTFNDVQTKALTCFTATHQAVVLTDNTSGYQGPQALHGALLCSQAGFKNNSEYVSLHPDLIIHIGEISGDYPTNGFLIGKAPVWRVSPDGELRDRLGHLTNVFEMPENTFFEHYTQGKKEQNNTFFQAWQQADKIVRAKIPSLPFSNPWMAGQLNGKLPPNSVLHLGILNSLRSWNYDPVQSSVISSCNVGGFGIDGMLSTLIGASLINPQQLCFGVVGDLAFFYDLNALGNRHIGNNLRILLVNNGCGGEFNMYNNPGSQFGNETNNFIAAGGHFGKQSPELVKHFAQDLGFTYLSACNKEEFSKQATQFLDPKLERSIIFECFTQPQDESDALKALNNLIPHITFKSQVKKVLPSSVKQMLKQAVKKCD